MGLTEDGRLTPLGSHALLDYDGVLSERVRETLRQSGASPRRLNDLIREAARSEPRELLGARELRARVETTISRAEFARLLTLLAHGGAAETYRRKVYVRFRVG